MIPAIDNIIKLNWEYKVDCLSNLSLSSNAVAIKYAQAYKDFDPMIWFEDDEDDLTAEDAFVITREWYNIKCKEYTKQDEAAGRPTQLNINTQHHGKIQRIYQDVSSIEAADSLYL